MDKKVALVLSGGGTKGAFQYAAERYAREEKGYQWDVIAGISVGALNGALLAMHEYQRLESLWEDISRDKVMTGRLNLGSLIKVAFGAKSIYGNQPLKELIQEVVDPDKIKVDLMVGAVSLTTGKYVKFTRDTKGFQEAVLASTAIPGVWEPVNVPTEDGNQAMVDGGVRNLSPLGDVLDRDPDEIVIINCSPRDLAGHQVSLNNALEIAKFSLELSMNEVFISDLREFLRINRIVKKAEDAGITLRKEEGKNKGKKYKAYECKIIEPDEDLGDTLDFSPQVIDDRMKKGREKAKQILG